MREKEDLIPNGEELYRRVNINDVDSDGVFASSIDLPRCSFNRGKYSKPEGVFKANLPNDNGIIYIVSENLPDNILHNEDNKKQFYEFCERDDPNPAEDPDNDAHCEIFINKVGTVFNPKKQYRSANQKELILKAKEMLARKLKILKMPE